MPLLFWVCFALLKRCVWYVELGCLGKRTPGDGNEEQGGSESKCFAMRFLQRSHQGDLVGKWENCSYPETSPPHPEFIPVVCGFTGHCFTL